MRNFKSIKLNFHNLKKSEISTQIRVLLLSPVSLYTKGGIASHLSNILPDLTQYYNIDVCLLNPPQNKLWVYFVFGIGKILRLILNGKLNLLWNSFWNDLYMKLKVIKYITSHPKPDIIRCQSIFAGTVKSLIKKYNLHIPIVLTR